MVKELVIHTQGLTRRFGPIAAVESLHLKIRRGEIEIAYPVVAGEEALAT